MSDFIITAWRPLKAENPETISQDDNVMSLYPCKVRKGRPGWIINYNYYGDKRLISGKYAGTIKQKDAVKMIGE